MKGNAFTGYPIRDRLYSRDYSADVPLWKIKAKTKNIIAATRNQIAHKEMSPFVFGGFVPNSCVITAMPNEIRAHAHNQSDERRIATAIPISNKTTQV